MRLPLVTLVLSGTLAQGAVAQTTRIQGFVDVSAEAVSRGDARSTATLGQYDLFITSKLADKFNFLGETVFEYDEGWLVDVERIVVTYSPSKALMLAFGKHHSPIGYWNTQYHHGALLQPTAQRPDLFRFEDEGGVLPIHTTGLLVAGRDIGRWHLGYDVMIGNGIGSEPGRDNNNQKSVTLALHSQVTSALRVGASLYSDKLSSGTPNPLGDPISGGLSQKLRGAFVAYDGSALQVMAEVQQATNTEANDVSHRVHAGYVYAGYRLGRFIPYARLDRIDTSDEDPYFTSGDVSVALAGGRFDVAPTVVIKVEAESRRHASERRQGLLRAQLAIGF